MRKLSVLIIAFFVAFSIIGPHMVVEKNAENWNNASYWKYNPIGVPPEWYGKLAGLPKTEWLEGTYQNGSFVYYYDFHYESVPQNILVIPNLTKSLRISIVDPHGKEYPVWNGMVPDSLNLGTVSSSIMRIAEEKCNPKPTWSQLLFHNPLKAVFAEPGTDCVFHFVPLRGTYKIVITGTFGKLESNDEPKVRILGLSYGRLGTDVYGRDVWTGYAYGARETIMISILGAGILALLAFAVGSLSVISTKFGSVVNAASKILTSTPSLPLAVLLVVVLGHIEYGLTPNDIKIHVNPYVMALIVAIVFIGTSSREIRSIVEEELRKEYIESSRAMGASPLQILRFHIFPVLLPYVVYLFAISVPGIIAFITLLGFFNVVPGFNWGTIMSTPLMAGIAKYVPYWWQIVPLGLSLGLIAYAFIDLGRFVEARFLKRSKT
ncbi:ABC-type dipeptide/oligopeptide/nickel transport systems, permease components [Thermococcus nautili]|uniref:ABC transporter permease subunit n=1 Tax=Thermococcus nautili TaxID=195522 RepID=UPI002556B978|nr:ABC transporter permease subunit [Thermococcus nautili]CAI1492516.1 ABC-type dipeptide/oligopeptide/nickel transport systems, permease components [Thermococcus nautili]